MSFSIKVIILEMIVNATISLLWAIGAFLAAMRDEQDAQRPLSALLPPSLRDRFYGLTPRWRWLVFWWMFTKSWLFFAIVLEIVGELPEWATEAVAAAFTAAHFAAFVGWLLLPSGNPAERSTQ